MKKIDVTIFLDGRPGHEKQSQGLLQALGEQAEICSYNEVYVRPQGILGTLGGVLGLWFNKGKKNQKICHGKIYIGTGRHTHLPLLRAAEKNGGLSFCAMLPGVLVRSFFSGCFVPQHDRMVRGDNIYRTCGPPIGLTDAGVHDLQRGLILVGGIDEKSHFWDGELLCRQLRQVVEADSRTWVLSSSPRTPDDTVCLLRQLAVENNRIEFYDYRDTPAGWVEERYHESGVVWVTADSISMVYEALSAGCRVGLLPVSWKGKGGKFRRSEGFLLEEGHLLSLAQWQDGMRWPSEKPIFNQAQWCAEKILEHV